MKTTRLLLAACFSFCILHSAFFISRAAAQTVSIPENTTTTMVISQTTVNASHPLMEYLIGDGSVLTLTQSVAATSAGGGFNINLANTGVVTIGPNPTALNATGSTIFRGFSAPNGGVVNVNQAGAILNMTNVTLDGNSATSNGGALRNAGGLMVLTNLYLSRNLASVGGGGIHNAAGTTAMTGITFVSNTATTNGGALFINNAGGYVTGTDIIFDGNWATGNGGGIQVNPGTLALTGAYFINNAAVGSGGAVQITNAAIITLTSATFTANYANTNGGAFVTNNATATLTDVDFKNNWAFGQGGAIYDSNNALANTTTLSLTGANGVTDYNYTGNFAGGSVGAASTDALATGSANFVASAAAGGFYYQNYSAAGATMTFDIATGVSLTIGDAAAGTNRANDTIASANANASITKTGSGSMTLNADNSYYSGTFAVNEGALLLGNAEATLGGIVTVATGATFGGSGTLATAGGGASKLNAATGSIIDIGATNTAPGALTVTDLAFTNATLKFDLFGYDTASSSYASDQLLVLGTLDLASTGTIFVSSLVTGTYDLGNLGSIIGNLTAIVQGGGARQSASLTTDATGTNLLLIAGADQSRILTWLGSTGPGGLVLAATPGSWTDSGTVNEFAPGDRIVFDATAPAPNRSITIDSAGVNASEMDIATPAATDAYTFAGAGAITTATRFIQPAATPAETLAADGKLHKTGPGTLTFANTAANNFESGIEISGGVLAFDNAAQIGTLDTTAAGGANADRGITFAATGTLRANATPANTGALTLASNIIIADAQTAALDTNNNALTYTGALSLAPADAAAGTPAATTGTLAKIGSGTLALAADNSAYAGSTQVAAGTLLLSGPAAKLGGAINVATDAVLAGNGAATGSVTLAPGATLIAGATHNNPAVTAPATLSITGALNLAAGATLKFDLYSDGASDLITVGSLNLLGTGTIDINTVGSGTYTLLTSAASLATLNLADLRTTLNGGSLGSARTAGVYTLSDNTENLLLSIETANLSLTWAGNTGATGNAWDALAANWTGADTQFVAGDKVTFTDAGVGAGANSGTIAIDPVGGAQPSDIVVNATADYTFTGGYIATTTNASGLADAPAGKLSKSGAGTLTLANASDRFVGGIEISAGVLAFSDAAQLNTLDAAGADRGITFAATGTLRANAPIANLTNAIIIADAQTAALDTNNNAVTYTGALSLAPAAGGAPAATSGTLAKLGAGTLALAADNSAYAGSTQIAAGTLLLSAGASQATPSVLGGNVTIAPGATLAGDGAITGSVTAAAGSLIDIGATAAAPGALTLGGLSLNGATIKFDLFGYDTASSSYQSDQLFVSTAAAAAPNLAGTGTIFINTYITGTYNLGNIGALADANNLTTVIGSGASGRQAATLLNDTATGDLLLIAGADQSRSLFWTGATSNIFDVSAGSWTTSDGSATNEFASGDKVTFDATHAATPAARLIEIPALGVNASEMDVATPAATDTYTFTGTGGITTGTRFIAPAANPANTLLADGKLHKTGAGTLTFANGWNNFEGGIEISGGVIEFGDGGQLNTWDAGTPDGNGGTLYNVAPITFTDSGTLRATADIPGAVSARQRLANIVIDDGKTAAFDTNGHTVYYSSQVSTTGASGTFAKLGAGMLVLSFTNAPIGTAGLATEVAEGALMLNSSTLAGNVNVRSGATFGNTNTGPAAAATVTLAASSTLQIQDALAIANLAIAANATLTGSGTLAGAATIATGATATVDTAAGSALTFANNFTGATGALAKTGAGALALESGANLAVNTIALNQGALLMRGNALSAATSFTIAGGAELRGSGVIQTPSLVNAGAIRVGNAADTSAPYGKLTLTGGNYTGAGGSVYLNIGLAGGVVAFDQFMLANTTISGTTNLFLNITGGPLTAAQLQSITPLDITGATIAPGTIFATPEAGGITVSDSPYLFAYSLANAAAGAAGAAGGAGGWYPIGYIPPLPAFMGVDAVSLLMSAAAIDSLDDHITALRGLQHTPKTRLWMNAIYRQDKLSSPYYDGASARSNGAQLGADWGNALSDTDHSLALGLCYDYVTTTLDIPARSANIAHSSVASRANGLGVYFALERARWYAAGAYHRTLSEKHEVTATTLGTIETKGNGWAASLEGGFKLLNPVAPTKWKAEIYAQWTYQTHAIAPGNDAVGTQGRLYQFSALDSSLLRAGARLWRDIALTRDATLRPYLRASYAHEQNADTRVTVLNLGDNLCWQFDNDMGGSGAIIEAGAVLELGDRFLLNAAATYYKVGKIQSTNLNLGAGISW